MNKNWLLIFAIFYFGFVLEANSQENTPKINSKKLLKVYVFGPFFSSGNDCEIELNKAYGFKLIDGKCVVTLRKKAHNKRINKKLKKLNGSDWQIQFEKDLLKCKNE
jgi:hypothetical protein